MDESGGAADAASGTILIGNVMRIGTWNLDARWDRRRHDLTAAENCDIWLLTETDPGTHIDGFNRHVSTGVMSRGQHWAAIFSRLPLIGLPDPHPACAAARVGNLTFCSSILPWRACGDKPPWSRQSHAEKTLAVITDLKNALPRTNLVWGGDWNHSLEGKEQVGSADGRKHLRAALEHFGLAAPTKLLPHRLGGYSIDHIAVSANWIVRDARYIPAECAGKRLSDHDVYIVDVIDPSQC